MMRGWFLKTMMVLIFLALVANIVVSARTGRSLITESVVRILAFSAVALANLCMAGAGVYFTTKTHEKHEKSSIEWGRRGFLTNFVVTIVLILSPFFFYPGPAETSLKMFDISLILLLFGVPNAVFLFSFYREYVRNVGSRPSSPRARRHTPSLDALKTLDGGPEDG